MVTTTSIEEKALKGIKKRLKETFLKVAQDKDTFDASRDMEEKNKLWAGAEALMGPADQDLKKFEFDLKLLPPSEGKQKLEKDLASLKVGFNDARSKYIQMEEAKNRLSLQQSSTKNSAGARYGARQAALGDDDYIKDTSVDTLGKLGKQDR